VFEGKALKGKLQAGEICLGTWINFTDPTVAELLTESGFDFFIIDSEHSALGIESVQLNIMATKGTPVTPIVRVAWNDPVLIKRVLDAGAGGVLVPLVRTVEDARAAVAACMYPPVGIRGFGPRRPASYERRFAEYIPRANENIVVWLQIEHADAVDNIEEIVAVDGIGGIILGPCDLSASMGMLGQTGHPDVLAAADKVIAAARKAGVPMGMAGGPNPKEAVEWIEKGAQFFALGADQSYLVYASQRAVNGVRKLLEERRN